MSKGRGLWTERNGKDKGKDLKWIVMPWSNNIDGRLVLHFRNFAKIRTFGINLNSIK